MTPLPGQARAAGAATAALLGATALGALLGAATPGLDQAAVHSLGLSFEPRPGSPDEVAHILATLA